VEIANSKVITAICTDTTGSDGFDEFQYSTYKLELRYKNEPPYTKVYDYDCQKEVDGGSYSYKLEYSTSKGESGTMMRTVDDETQQQVDR